MKLGYLTDQPTPEEISALQGPAVLQFGTNWCGYCVASEPVLEGVFAEKEGLRVIKAEDAKGRPLGRSFGVKLWPTVVFLRDGEEVTRLVRPTSRGDVAEALAAIM